VSRVGIRIASTTSLHYQSLLSEVAQKTLNVGSGLIPGVERKFYFNLLENVIYCFRAITKSPDGGRREIQNVQPAAGRIVQHQVAPGRTLLDPRRPAGPPSGIETLT